MQLALLLSRLLLSAVFLLAGVAKLGDAKGAIQALKDFGIPSRLAPPVSLLLLAAEIAVGAALIPTTLDWYGAWGALALFCIFALGIGVAMARGRDPECHCFGKLHSSRVGWPTLTRNGILAALAGWLVLRGPGQLGPSLWAHVVAAGENERKLFIIAGIVMCFLFFRALKQRPAPAPVVAAEESEDSGWFGDSKEEETADQPPDPTAEPEPAVAVQQAIPQAAPKPMPAPAAASQAPPLKPAPVRKPPVSYVPPIAPALREALAAGTGLPIGTHAPEFILPNLLGQSTSLHSLREPGKTTCLVFATPHCDACRAVMPDISRWSREHSQALNFVVISRGSATPNMAKANGLDPARVLLQQQFELSDNYGVRSTPAAVLIAGSGHVQSQIAVGRPDIQKLVSSAVPSNRKTPSEPRSA